MKGKCRKAKGMGVCFCFCFLFFVFCFFFFVFAWHGHDGMDGHGMVWYGYGMVYGMAVWEMSKNGDIFFVIETGYI